MYIQIISGILLLSTVASNVIAKECNSAIFKVQEKCSKLNVTLSSQIIIVNTAKQTMHLLQYKSNGYHSVKKYIISSSKRGMGQQLNTYKTPAGLHRITNKIGANAPKYAIFKSRKYVANWKQRPRNKHFRDYILTRILHLDGLEPGFNKGCTKNGTVVDSFNRGIYIHGTTMTWKLGTPSSIGCIHMHPNDVMDLFDKVATGTIVWITNKA